MPTHTHRFASAVFSLLGLLVFAQSAARAVTINASIGQAVNLTVTADGSAPFSYQWKKDGSILSGATTNSYAIGSAQSGNAGVYSVVVSNSAGTASSDSATLTVSSVAVAPVITLQPVGATAVVGSSVSFTAAASGTPTPALQWRKDGVNIVGATASSYAISNVTEANAGTYVVTATNSAGSSTSTGALLTVQSAPVSITTATVSTGTLNAAYSATLAASGGVAPYRWTISSGALPTGLVLNANTGAITGTSTTIGSFSFTAKVTDGGTPVQSVTKAFTVVVAIPSTSIWPASAVPTVMDGGADTSVELGVRFRSDVAGKITGIRFYKATANTGVHIGNLWSSTGTLLATATFSGESASGWQQVTFSSPVTISANTVYVASYHSNNGHYSSDLNQFGADVVASPLRALASTATSGNGVYAYGAGSIFPNQTYKSCNYWVDVSFQAESIATLSSIAITPATSTITAGATQQFTATGTYSDSSTRNLTSQVTWASSNTASATINAAGLATSISAGNTTISASNSGVASASATLFVNPVVVAPVITTQPAGKTAIEGESFTFTAAASGVPSPTYQWRKNGINLIGATSASYTIGAVAATDASTYSLIATNSVGSVTSNDAVLNVVSVPVIMTQPISQTVDAASSVTFVVGATGLPSPLFQWTKNGENISGATAASYTVTNAAANDAAAYAVKVSNSAGSVTSGNAVLVVNPLAIAPMILLQPIGQIAIAGETTGFSVTATGLPAPTYQWKQGGVEISGATENVYSISNSNSGHAGSYTVVVSNSAGSVTSAVAVLTVNPAPSTPIFTSQPASQIVKANTNVTFSAAATGVPSPTFQWRKNGAAISGATNSTYTISAVAASHAGAYTVIATNASGSVTSAEATLTVTSAATPSQKTDFNADGKTDILWQNVVTKEARVWLMNGTAFASTVSLGTVPAPWKISGTGDFDGDGLTDLLCQNMATGERSIWLMAGTAQSSTVSLGVKSLDWQISGVGDFNQDKRPDIVLQNVVTGEVNVWLMAGTQVASVVAIKGQSTDWQLASVGDFNNDGKSDLVWQNNITGAAYLWLMSGTSITWKTWVSTRPIVWQISGSGDFDGDGKSDLLWQNVLTGDCELWIMSANNVKKKVSLGTQSIDWVIRN